MFNKYIALPWRIYCAEVMPVKRFMRRAKTLVIVIVLAACALFIYMDFNLKPVIMSLAEARAKILGVEAINKAAYEIISSYGSLTYADLISVKYDSEGRVSMLQAQTMRMNEIATRTALLAQRNMEALTSVGIRIPVGAATGSRLLAGRCPAITVNMVPIGSVQSEFESAFTAAGINQTRHSVYLKVTANVRMAIPTASAVASVSTYIQIAESVIVGVVPGTFANVAPENVLDLLPNR